jgi:hypothetical protein
MLSLKDKVLPILYRDTFQVTKYLDGWAVLFGTVSGEAGHAVHLVRWDSSIYIKKPICLVQTLDVDQFQLGEISLGRS